jgi:polyisoprenoid-binding protein YceI
MNKKYLTFVLLFLVNFAIAQVKYTAGKSSATFQIKNMGFNTSGHIDGIKADILFDAANPANITITAVANVSSLNTGSDAKDEHLKSADFFDVATYPTITIKSTAIKHKSGNNYVGQFNVTIKNKTQSLPIPFTYTDSGSSAIFNGVLKLKRSDFGIGGSSLVLSDDVTVTINVEANK